MDLIFQNVDIHIGDKQILDQISGVVKHGEMLAVMGESGAGKSTLLNAIAGRCNLTNGFITLNNQPLDKQLRRKVAYVLQQDVFFPTLTLKETLTYSALLRLPDNMPHKLKLQRVDEIIEVLELTKCATTVIGDVSTTGLSGGEKKRASIGTELLTNPLVLLLDEPTSGLDSAVAFNLMTTMSKYTTKTDKTLIVTIHQPSSEIFHMFDNLLLMTDGKVAYFGKGCKVLEFFESCGLHCAVNYNPADFILMKVRKSASNLQSIFENSKKQRQKDWPVTVSSATFEGKYINTTITAQDETVNHSYNNESLNVSKEEANTNIFTVKTRRKSGIVTSDKSMAIYQDRNSKWPTGFKTQYSTLVKRSFKLSISDVFSVTSMVDLIAQSVIFVLAWFQMQRTELEFPDLMGAMTFILVRWECVLAVQGTLEISNNKAVTDRERAGGIYRLSAWYLAITTSEMLLCTIRPLLFMAIAYWVIGLSAEPSAYFLTLGIYFLYIITANSIGMMIGIMFSDSKYALIITTSVAATAAIFGDYFRRNLPVWLDWIRYCSYVNYGFHGLLNIQLTFGQPFICAAENVTEYTQCVGNTSMGTNKTTALVIPPSAIMDKYSLTIPLWVNMLALLTMSVLFRLIGYLQLRYKHVQNKKTH